MSAPSQGKVKEVTSTSNPIIKSIKALAQKKHRDSDGLFLVEGYKLVTDAMIAGWEVRTLIYSRELLKHPKLGPMISDAAAKVRAQGGDILQVNDKILTSITRRENAQSVVAVIRQSYGDLKKLSPQTEDVYIALDRVRDPGNLGTIVRTSDALGAKGVILIDTCTDPFALEAVRATMGSLFHVPLYRTDTAHFIEFVSRLREEHGGHCVGTHLEGSVDHRQIKYSGRPTILLMGNEQQGLTAELAEGCDELARIAMAGQADSLNLAIATSIMLFEARRHIL